MPLIHIHLTKEQADNAERESILKSASEIIARETGKPEAYCMALISPSDIVMGGESGPAAFVDIRSIGGVSPSVAKNISGGICALFADRLSIPKDRVYLNFSGVDAPNWGWNGGTF